MREKRHNQTKPSIPVFGTKTRFCPPRPRLRTLPAPAAEIRLADYDATIMNARTIHLPIFQHFDCHSCGYCCRNLVVNVSDAERQKILNAGWAARMTDLPLFVRYRFRGRRLHRLNQRPDGRCVFLGENERCRLHAETGIGTKPLACRLYPFVPTPGADSVRIDVRADCPSVAADKGRSIGIHHADIRALVTEVGVAPMASPPLWRSARPLTAAEFSAVANGFDSILRRGSLPVRTRLHAGSRLLSLLCSVRAAKVRDQRFIELMQVLSEAAVEETREGSSSPPAVSPRVHRLFRQWLFLHAVTDDPRQLDEGFLKRMRRSWVRYAQARRFARGSGPAPMLRADWPVTDFESIARVAPAPDAALEPLCRSLRVKLDAHAFAGPGYYGCDVITGLTALWLLPSVVGWLGRLSAVAAGRSALSAEDVLAGLRSAHHTFGVSPVFARISERLRLRALAQEGVAFGLLAAYGP